MNELHQVLLVTLGTVTLLLCLPACTRAQPEGVFKLDLDKYQDAAFDADYRSPQRLTQEQVREMLFQLALARSGKPPAYTLPRKRQSNIGLGLFQLMRLSEDERLRNERDLLDRMASNDQTFENIGRRR